MRAFDDSTFILLWVYHNSNNKCHILLSWQQKVTKYCVRYILYTSVYGMKRIELQKLYNQISFLSIWSKIVLPMNNQKLQLKVTLPAVRIIYFIWYIISYTLKIELAATFIIMVENSMEVYFVEYLNAFCHSV